MRSSYERISHRCTGDVFSRSPPSLQQAIQPARQPGMMGDMPCYEPSSLISSIHKNVPFLTDVKPGDHSEELVMHLGDGTRAFYDHFVRALFWGIFIVLVAIVLLAVSCCCYCCSICCFCLGHRGEVAKSKRSKCTCGILLFLTAVFSLCLCAVGIWAETELDSRIVDKSSSINNFLDSVLNSESASGENSTVNPFVAADTARHWAIVGFLILLMTLLVGVVIVVLCSPVCQSPTVVVITVALCTIITFLTALAAGAVFSFLVIFSDVCYGLFSLGGKESCGIESSAYRDDLDVFCNEAYQYGMMSFGVLCSIVVGFFTVQVLGGVFAGLLTGHSRLSLTKSDIELDGPSVWDAYGTHNLSGLTSESVEISDSFESTMQLYPDNGSTK